MNRLKVSVRSQAVTMSALLIAASSFGIVRRAPAQPMPTNAKKLMTWRKAMVQTPLPKKKACFAASYPERKWKEVQCKTPPNRPYPPKLGPHGAIVGNGSDISAGLTGNAASAEGSFDDVSGVRSETANGNANSFSLQLNTNFFTTSACSTFAGCQGWEQFVYTSSGGGFIQYWMVNYGTGTATCPQNWNRFVPSGTSQVDCWINSNNSAPVPSETISSLAALSVTGTSGGTASNDSITVGNGSSTYSATGDNHFSDLSSHWQMAEFNVFGDGNGDQANFNIGSTIKVRTAMQGGSTNAPSIVSEGFTGETNNLTLVPGFANANSGTGSSLPAIAFTESNVFENRILETPTTFGNESDGTWLMSKWSDPHGKPDLVFIKTSNTPNGHVEVHVASAASNYQTRVLETATTFANENDGTWLMANWSNPGGKPDLVFIKTSNTPNGHVEVHMASAASNYQTRVLETATTFANENDGTWLMANWSNPGGKPDLIFLKTNNTQSGHVEVHVASAASNYQTRVLELPTTFGNENDGAWLMPQWANPNGPPDLGFIKTSSTPNGHVEVHVAQGE